MNAIDEYKLMNAANDYGMNIRKGYPRVMDETDVYIRNAFEAGAKWAAANIQSDIPPIKTPKPMKIEAQIIEVLVAEIDQTSGKYAYKVEYRIEYAGRVGRWLFHSIHADRDIANYVKAGIEDMSIPVLYERPR